MELTEDQKTQLSNLKAHFPYRVIFGVLYNDGKFESYAEHDKRKLNKFVKNPDCLVFLLQGVK
jgi:hypothetical protein